MPSIKINRRKNRRRHRRLFIIRYRYHEIYLLAMANYVSHLLTVWMIPEETEEAADGEDSEDSMDWTVKVFFDKLEKK